jgi:hypothetical protein
MTRSRFVFGVGFVALGVVLLLGQLEVLDAGDVIGTWWPSIIVLAGVAQVATRPRNLVGASILVALGGVLLLARLEVVDAVGLVWPALLIAFGVWLVARRPGAQAGSTALEGEVVAVFNDRDVRAAPGPLTDHSLTTVFGDLDLDLRDTTIEREATLQVTTVFGDVDLEVPDTWRVTVSGPELFGDVRVVGGRDLPADAPRLHLRTTTVFGDLEVRPRAVLGAPTQEVRQPGPHEPATGGV